MYMMQLHGTKVISLTTGGLTDERTYFYVSSDNSSREKSAEVIVDMDTSSMMVKEKSGGLTKYRRTELYESEYNKSKLPNGRQKAENIAR